jgi:uncharacterized membrane protein
MRPFSPRSRGALTALVVLALLLAVPAPALSASPLSPGRALDGGDGDGHEAPPGDRSTAKWTYLLYMSADNNLEDEAILNFNQMEDVGSSDDVNVVLQLDRSPEWDETNGNWTGTRRYYVLPDDDPDIINSQLLDDMGEVDMGDADNLRDFVVWAVTSYPAERYYLDVWGHGGGWRDGTCNDYTSGSVIDIDELGTALTEAEDRTNVTLDGLGFDQCLMAQLEVFYEIKARADVLVGAETLIPADGYNYTRVIGPLVADPDMGAAELAGIIVTAFFDEYGFDNDRAHSAVDSEGLDADLAQAMTRMAQLLRANASSLRDEIKLARDKAQTFSTLDYIDLGNFTEQLLLTLPENETELRRAVAEVGENVTASVVAEGHGIGRGGSTGLSFYFPRYGVAWNYANIQMSQEGRWDEFLKAYFDRRDRPNEAPTLSVTAPLAGSVVGLEFALEGTANDTDGNVTHVEWKFDRGPWSSSEAREDWQVNASTAGLDPGLHRVSVRSRDDVGDYSPEVQFTVNVESKGLELFLGPGTGRTHPGGSTTTDLVVSAFGEDGADVSMEVASVPEGWTVGLPFDQVQLAPRGSKNGTMMVDVSPDAGKGPYQVLVRAWVTAAPLIQAFAVLHVEVTDRWADLVVVDLVLSPEEPAEGEVMTINFSVVNTGLAPALSFDVELFHRFAPGMNESSTLIRRLHVDRLEVGERLDVSDSWRATIGTHEFVAEADGARNNTDLDRTDNSHSRLMVLHGYAVMFGASPRDVNVTPGQVVHFALLLRNEGNLWDTLVLSHVNSTLGWTHRFNSTMFSLDPKDTHEADLWVDVPEDVTGGAAEQVTVRLASTGDLTKYQDIVLRLLYPEEFGLMVTQDREEGTIGPLADDSFNITIENTGNGHEVYDLEYIRQRDHLFISAVNESVEVAPGCSTSVEVFFSTMDTDVGGQSFDIDLRVRSRDDPTTMVSLSFNVTVARVFGLEAEVVGTGDAFEVLLGTPLLLPLEVTNVGNYHVTLEVHLLIGDELFPPPPATLGEVSPGDTEEFTIVLVPRTGALMGTYTVTLEVRDELNLINSTTAGTMVEVLRVDSSSLRVEDADPTVLRPGVNWRADLVLSNDGNHVESYSLNTSYVPDWLLVELSEGNVTLEPGSETTVQVRVWLTKEGFDAPDTVMLVVNANPANATDGSPKAVLDIALDVPPAEEAPWGLVAILIAATVVVLAVLIYIRSERLRS